MGVIISNVCSTVVSLLLFLGIPGSIVWLLVALIKKKEKKVPLRLLIGCVVAMIVFSLVGSVAWSKTDEYKEYLAEKEKEEQNKPSDTNKTEKDTQANSNIEKNTEKDTELTEAEKVANMTEEEYKVYCREMYSEELASCEGIEGTHVKIYGKVRQIDEYTDDSMFGIVIADTRDKYNLSSKYISFWPASEMVIFEDEIKGFLYVAERKVYLVFEEGKDAVVDEYMTGDEIVIYGEIVQCWSGTFIIPRYIEDVEINIPVKD